MRYHLIIFTFLSLTLIGGCAKKSRLPSQEDTLGADSKKETSNEMGGLGIYPHSEKFRLTNEHGLTFYQEKEKCMVCHGKDLEGGRVEVACRKCHGGVFPHTESFKKEDHGGKYLENRSLCTLCHGFDYKGGNSKVACVGCHSYPHPKKWAFQDNHGGAYVNTLDPKVAEEKQKSSCLHCHGEDSLFKQKFEEKYPGTFVSCGTCHTPIPHSEDFTYGDHDVLARTYAGKCTLCHTGLKRLLPSLDNGCYDCHDEDKLPIMKWVKPDEDK
ncbi:MAG: hypothetical protein A3B70_06710 [Deltaproteobacteria bacterium RIFCSPHIGHO2_02_FULL_40_11]|nr:MAG: hypothetical protein A3B70_06710 [Deltaproteobacteria bacterium RIFCSPHIGHO2_02_FULL_40_11]